jgi:hypothetical protein
MIPIPERFVPQFIKQNRKVRLLLIVCLFLGFIFLVIYEAKQIDKGFRAGPDMRGLRKNITNDLFDSVAVGLRMFYAEHRHYPKIDGKHFFDSIKQYISVDDVYVYADSLDKDGRMTPIKKRGGKNFDYCSFNNTYLGIGSHEFTIIYRLLTPDSYLLYSVGENHIDEDGHGDDVLYEH